MPTTEKKPARRYANSSDINWFNCWPARVWDESTTGWTSREATREDNERRAAFANQMSGFRQ